MRQVGSGRVVTIKKCESLLYKYIKVNKELVLLYREFISHIGVGGYRVQRKSYHICLVPLLKKSVTRDPICQQVINKKHTFVFERPRMCSSKQKWLILPKFLKYSHHILTVNMSI